MFLNVDVPLSEYRFIFIRSSSTPKQRIKFLNDLTVKGAYVMMSNRDIGDGFFEARQGRNDVTYFDVTYTAGRRKKNEDGTHSAKKAREILMIGKK